MPGAGHRPRPRARRGSYFDLPSPVGAAHSKRNGFVVLLRRAFTILPVANLVVIYFLVSHRMLQDVEPDCEAGAMIRPPDPAAQHQHQHQQDLDPGCLNDCNQQGICVDGGCQCLDQFSGEDCSVPRCPRDCSGLGTCLPTGTCLCKGRFVGPDCSIDMSDLRMDNLRDRVGAPFQTGGKLTDQDMELVMNVKSRQAYQHVLCHSKQCSFSWMSTFITLGPYLPRNDYKPHFKTCAVVSSSKQLVYGNATAADSDAGDEPPRRPDGHGRSIDKHYMVMRLDNAPVDGYQEWTGSRTTHRLVQQDYARLVLNMLGTEQIVNKSKTVVTPSTWWVGSYPEVEKVTYLMSVPPTPMSGGKEMRSPEHQGYSSFTDVFPGNRRFLLSPIFLQKAAEINRKMQHSLAVMALDCIRQQQTPAHLNALFVAVLFSLQVCDHVDVYGVSVSHGGRDNAGSIQRTARDANFKGRVEGVSDKGSCCYYPLEEDYKPEVSLCDQITRRYTFRLLQESGNIAFHE